MFVMRLFDTHFHLDLYPDPSALVTEANQAQTCVVAVTNTPSVFESTQQLTAASQFVQPALGLHPELAVERQLELPLFEHLLPYTRYVGEVGLDFVITDARERAIQQEVFRKIVALCHASGNKILTVHSRRAEKEVVQAIGPTFAGQVILHWYSGPLSVARQAVENGLYFSLNPAMVRSKRFVDLLAIIPRERLLLETDGPFVQIGSRPAIPKDTAIVIRALAVLWHMSEEQVAQTLFTNFRQLLTLPA
ncbi:MAG: TatD family deoxyribonuclease [Hymenobacter sp.]|nr:MAG: TatD family deoxyribonuclease [Hymenobacter sp.]